MADSGEGRKERWTIKIPRFVSGGPIILGPTIGAGKSVEVVPASRLESAEKQRDEALAELARSQKSEAGWIAAHATEQARADEALARVENAKAEAKKAREGRFAEAQTQAWRYQRIFDLEIERDAAVAARDEALVRVEGLEAELRGTVQAAEEFKRVAETAVSAERRATQAEAVLEEAREALRWYANRNRYRVGEWPQEDGSDGSILPDQGERARAALQSERSPGG